jgi:mannose-6-phosphate isomerase-like protein (cupin superfamily)
MEISRHHTAHLPDIAPVRCPCGWARRAFADVAAAPASVHLVEILEDACVHYHKVMTEHYVILETEGPAFLELDGEQVPVKPLDVFLIQPGCRHRAVGKMKILNIPVPAFDAADEYFD